MVSRITFRKSFPMRECTTLSSKVRRKRSSGTISWVNSCLPQARPSAISKSKGVSYSTRLTSKTELSRWKPTAAVFPARKTENCEIQAQKCEIRNGAQNLLSNFDSVFTSHLFCHTDFAYVTSLACLGIHLLSFECYYLSKYRRRL